MATALIAGALGTLGWIVLLRWLIERKER